MISKTLAERALVDRIKELEAEVARLKGGISDLQMYNGDQEEVSKIFARLKKEVKV